MDESVTCKPHLEGEHLPKEHSLLHLCAASEGENTVIFLYLKMLQVFAMILSEA